MNFNNAEFSLAYGIADQLPQSTAAEVAFAGRSNVGKSSLINRLCNRKSLARVSSSPGKTATVNFYKVDSVFFVDLPGYGFAKVSHAERMRWDKLINSYFSMGRSLRLCVQLVDSRHDPSEDDLQMMHYLQHYRIPFVCALTKADKLKKTEAKLQFEKLSAIASQYGCIKTVLTSSEKGLGMEELKAVIEEMVLTDENG